MDDLDGLFGSAPVASPPPQLGNMNIMTPPQQANMMSAPQPANHNMMIPTQTTEASQQANKTQILNQFQAGAGQALYGGQGGLGQIVGGPARPAPVAPAQVFPGQTLAPPDQPLPGASLILSNSFTEPGPVDMDPCADPFAETKQEPTVDIPDTGSSFFIDENEITTDSKEEAKTEDIKEETLAPEAPKEVESVSPQPKTSFWSRWSRSKDSGSKENILEENDKKADKHNDDGKKRNTLLIYMLTDTKSFLAPVSVSSQISMGKNVKYWSQYCYDSISRYPYPYL